MCVVKIILQSFHVLVPNMFVKAQDITDKWPPLGLRTGTPHCLCCAAVCCLPFGHNHFVTEPFLVVGHNHFVTDS
jgi:hypothetical protein